MQLFEHCRTALVDLCRQMGIAVSPEAWTSRYEAWLRQLHAAQAEIDTALPPDSPFILADLDEIRAEIPAGRRAVPFPERDGVYWGLPADDAAALAELDRLRTAGYPFFVMAWPTFWWSDHYQRFHQHLLATYRQVLSSDRLKIFDLREET
jgi:hypothetical protein